jgi:hypothetical protein
MVDMTKSVDLIWMALWCPVGGVLLVWRRWCRYSSP